MTSSSKLIAAAALALCSAGLAAQTVTIRFDNGGDESGITTPGTMQFEFMGSAWSGGVVGTEGITSLYASGAFSYEVPNGPAMVVFDQPVVDVEFFYVHGSGFAAGTATAFDASGGELASVDSNSATSFGDPDNFVTFNTAEPISAIEFSGGVIDNFSYTVADAFVADYERIEGQWVTAGDAFNMANEGLTFDFLEFADTLFLAWFTHTAMPEMPSDDAPVDVGAPDNRWMVATMAISGNTVSGDLAVVTGGEFDAPRTEFQETRLVGRIDIEFTACDRATVSYSIDQPALAREFEIIPLEKRLGSHEAGCEPTESAEAGGGDGGGGTGGGY